MAKQTGITFEEWKALRQERLKRSGRIAEELRACLPGWPKEYHSRRPPKVVCLDAETSFGSYRDAGLWAGGCGAGVAWGVETGRKYKGYRWAKYDPKQHWGWRLVRSREEGVEA